MKVLCIVLLTVFLFAACAVPEPYVAESIIDVPERQFDYINEKYGFGIDLPEDYRTRQLENGIVLQKDVAADPAYDPEDPEGSLAAYRVEIVFMPFENLTEYGNLNDYISFKYGGYTIEGVNYANVSGYYVDEGLGSDAVRHFFAGDNDGRVIYEAYLKLPSYHYSKYLEEFEAVLKTMEIF